MTLQLDSLRKAILALQKSLVIAHTNLVQHDDNMQEVIRAGIVQNFEVTYEQSWKFMQRWLRENATSEETELLRTRKELFRIAGQYGLIDNPEVWFEYGDARNMTSHTYDEENAIFVCNIAERFIFDAEKLLLRLENGQK